jgi:hypothetical protein
MNPLKIVYYGLLGLCLITLLLNVKRLGKTYVWFLPLISLAIAVQLADEFLNWYAYTDFALFHIYQPLEFLFLAFFYNEIFKQKSVKISLFVAVICHVAFTVFYYVFFKPEQFHEPTFPEFTVQAGFVCIYAVAFFIQLSRSNEYIKLKVYPAFWINAGNLLFYAGCLLVMGVNLYLERVNQELAFKIMEINYYLNLALYTLYFYAFTCLRNNSSRNTQL